MDALSAIDGQIREGAIGKARARLDALLRAKGAGRANRCRLANLLWRVGWPSRGIRILSPLLSRQGPDKWESYPDESAEYAVCLAKLGAFEEAKWILRHPRVAEASQAPLYLGFSYLETWDYEKAIPHFRAYLDRGPDSEYAALVGQVNLAAALAYERHHDEARPILDAILSRPDLARYVYLYGYALEASAADAILSGRLDRAEHDLTQAEQRWASLEGLDRFLLDKWSALLALWKKKDAGPLTLVQRRAIEIAHWETVRDCERHLALALRDDALALKLYFGTPYQGFRDRLMRDYGTIEIPERYAVELGEGPDERTPVSVLVDPPESLTSQNRALLGLLASDRYRPQRLATLFGWLFPDERYHAASTPKRMHEAIRRLGAWLRSQRVPIGVEEIGTGYRLAAVKPVALWVPRPGDSGDSWRPLLLRLHRKWGLGSFALRDVAAEIDLPRRTLLPHLQSLVTSGHLRRTGRGAGTRYQVAERIEPYLKLVG